MWGNNIFKTSGKIAIHIGSERMWKKWSFLTSHPVKGSASCGKPVCLCVFVLIESIAILPHTLAPDYNESLLRFYLCLY